MAEIREKKVVKAVKKVPTPKVGTKVPSDGTFAIIETGGKQYSVTSGDTIKIEKLLGDHKVGDSVDFDKVLLIEGTELHIGKPLVEGSKVSGTITEIGRNKKVTVIKYKQKSRYFKKNGHRQPFFKVLIGSIV
jgi:large subunit ribosomal protein L21